MTDLAAIYETKSNGEEHKDPSISFPKIERHQFEYLDVSHNAKGKRPLIKGCRQSGSGGGDEGCA
jgi:hypothetical protein